VALLKELSAGQRIALVFAAIFFMGAGALHFIRPDFYVKIVPPYIPAALVMVRVSGFLEITGGLGLLVPQTRRAAAWGLVILLIAIFPANVYMATNPVETGAESLGPLVRWGRLPLQLVFIWWALWCSRPRLLFR